MHISTSRAFGASLLLASVMFVGPNNDCAASPARHWTLVKGDNVVDVGPEGLHLTQTRSGDTTSYATATAGLNLTGASRWRVEFDVRFGKLRSAGACVRLNSETTKVGWVGADGWFKGMGTFIGDTSIGGQTANTQWHHYVYASDGQALTVWLDGSQVASDATPGVPSSISVGTWWDHHGPAGQQTEIWLKNVHEEIVKAPPPQFSALNSQEPDPAKTANPSDIHLHVLVQDYNDTLIRAQEACKAVQNSCQSWEFYDNLMLKAVTVFDYNTDSEDADLCRESFLKYMADQNRELRTALNLHQSIDYNGPIN